MASMAACRRIGGPESTFNSVTLPFAINERVYRDVALNVT